MQSLQSAQDHYGNHYHIYTGHVDVLRAAESGDLLTGSALACWFFNQTFHAGRIQWFVNRTGGESGQWGACLICSKHYHR